MLTEREPLTEDELRVAYELWLMRMKGLAATLKPEFYPAAVALHERGWVSHRSENGGTVWEFTDAGLMALNLRALLGSVEGREN